MRQGEHSDDSSPLQLAGRQARRTYFINPDTSPLSFATILVTLTNVPPLPLVALASPSLATNPSLNHHATSSSGFSYNPSLLTFS